jgi:polyferredoxin
MVKQEDSPYVPEKETDRHSVEVRMPAKGDAPQNSDAPFKKLVNAAVLIVLVILVFFAMLSFFFNMQEAIAALINPKYQALVQALFSLVVLVIGIYTIKRFLSNKS